MVDDILKKIKGFAEFFCIWKNISCETRQQLPNGMLFINETVETKMAEIKDSIDKLSDDELNELQILLAASKKLFSENLYLKPGCFIITNYYNLVCERIDSVQRT